MVHSYAALKTTPEVIQENLGMTPEEFDKEFQAWLYKGVQQTVDNFDKWREATESPGAGGQRQITPTKC